MSTPNPFPKTTDEIGRARRPVPPELLERLDREVGVTQEVFIPFLGRTLEIEEADE